MEQDIEKVYKLKINKLEEENKFLRNQELGYIAGYEDGKKHKMTAVAMRNENMKYELYERHIKALKKRIEDLLSIEEHRKENYIPVSLVEETIEELKHKDFIAIQVCSQHDNKALAQIQVLQELLEKRK